MESTTAGVTVRDLYRHAAALIDQVERTGRGIVISRFGRAVAYLGPLPAGYEPSDFARVHVPPRFEPLAVIAADDAVGLDACDREPVALDERQRGALLAVAAEAGERWMPQTQEEVKMWLGPLYHLECAGLVDKVFGGWRITPKGRRVASENPVRGAGR